MDDADQALAQLAAAAALTDARPENIRRARAGGKTWEQVATAAKMSRASVINLSKRESSKK